MERKESSVLIIIRKKRRSNTPPPPPPPPPTTTTIPLNNNNNNQIEELQENDKEIEIEIEEEEEKKEEEEKEEKERNNNKYEVLLGQNEIKNYLKSSKNKTIFMNYPGEWKFPGGVKDQEDSSLLFTAIRELKEEFNGIILPNNIENKIKYLNQKETFPIRNRQYIISNYLYYDQENQFNSNQINQINQNLELKRRRYKDMLQDESYWNLNTFERHQISPEVYQVQWIDLDEAIFLMESSLYDTLNYVNEYQQREFEKYNISSRDPMYQSMMTLRELREISNLEEFLNS